MEFKVLEYYMGLEQSCRIAWWFLFDKRLFVRGTDSGIIENHDEMDGIGWSALVQGY